MLSETIDYLSLYVPVIYFVSPRHSERSKWKAKNQTVFLIFQLPVVTAVIAIICVPHNDTIHFVIVMLHCSKYDFGKTSATRGPVLRGYKLTFR